MEANHPSSNTDKNDESSTPSMDEHDNGSLSPSHKKQKTASLLDEDVHSKSTSSLDQIYVDTKELDETSPSHANPEDDYELHGFIDGLFSSMQTYQMEFDVEDIRGRIPQCFVREFGDLIGASMILEDPNENQIEVRVDKSSHEWFFAEGWSTIKNAYNILFGAWVTFAYVNPKVLLIRLMTRWGTEVQYPSHKPPFKYLLAKEVIYGQYSVPNLAKPISSNVSHKFFMHSYVKKITLYDIESGVLHLPWYGFGEYVFAFAYSDLVLVDCIGGRYTCSLKFGVDSGGELACKLSRGWVDFCTTHGLAHGQYVRFCVPYPTGAYVMYVSIVSNQHM